MAFLFTLNTIGPTMIIMGAAYRPPVIQDDDEYAGFHASSTAGSASASGSDAYGEDEFDLGLRFVANAVASYAGFLGVRVGFVTIFLSFLGAAIKPSICQASSSNPALSSFTRRYIGTLVLASLLNLGSTSVHLRVLSRRGWYIDGSGHKREVRKGWACSGMLGLRL